MTAEKAIKPNEIPAGDTVINFGNGLLWPLMFLWATEESDLELVANKAGFDVEWVAMTDDLDMNNPLRLDYHAHGANVVLAEWEPTPPSPEWSMVARYDTHNGPEAIFARRRPQVGSRIESGLVIGVCAHCSKAITDKDVFGFYIDGGTLCQEHALTWCEVKASERNSSDSECWGELWAEHGISKSDVDFMIDDGKGNEKALIGWRPRRSLLYAEPAAVKRPWPLPEYVTT